MAAFTWAPLERFPRIFSRRIVSRQLRTFWPRRPSVRDSSRECRRVSLESIQRPASCCVDRRDFDAVDGRDFVVVLAAAAVAGGLDFDLILEGDGAVGS